MNYDSFARDRLPPPELQPEFRFDLPELQYPDRLTAAAELLKGGAPDGWMRSQPASAQTLIWSS